MVAYDITWILLAADSFLFFFCLPLYFLFFSLNSTNGCNNCQYSVRFKIRLIKINKLILEKWILENHKMVGRRCCTIWAIVISSSWKRKKRRTKVNKREVQDGVGTINVLSRTVEWKTLITRTRSSGQKPETKVAFIAPILRCFQNRLKLSSSMTRFNLWRIQYHLSNRS